ncbi:MAG: hypothetical protein RSE12_08540 [Fuscovulum sp.]|nr:MAG: hypothetical protein RSE12_08540 [Fuscovulum sp.]
MKLDTPLDVWFKDVVNFIDKHLFGAVLFVDARGLSYDLITELAVRLGIASGNAYLVTRHSDDKCAPPEDLRVEDVVVALLSFGLYEIHITRNSADENYSFMRPVCMGDEILFVNEDLLAAFQTIGVVSDGSFIDGSHKLLWSAGILEPPVDILVEKAFEEMPASVRMNIENLTRMPSTGDVSADAFLVSLSTSGILADRWRPESGWLYGRERDRAMFLRTNLAQAVGDKLVEKLKLC